MMLENAFKITFHYTRITLSKKLFNPLKSKLELFPSFSRSYCDVS
jgi:hypothetical protein